MRSLSLARASIAAIVFILVSQAAFGQSPTSTPSPPAIVRDAQAIATVQSAIAAMGGTAAVAAIQDATFQGTIQEQTPAPSAGQTSDSLTFTWMTAGAQFREETTGATSHRIYVSNSGSPVDQRDGQNVTVPPFVAQVNLPYQLPGLVLLNELNNPNYTISFVGPTNVNGTAAIQVHTCDETDYTSHLIMPQEWYFDASTGLPIRVEYKLPKDTDVEHPWSLSIDFSNFTAAGAILVPRTLTINAGPATATATVNSVALNSGVPASAFAAPSAGAQ